MQKYYYTFSYHYYYALSIVCTYYMYFVIIFIQIYISGIAMSQMEMEQITDHFDPYQNGYVDLSEIAFILRGYHKIRSLNKRRTYHSKHGYVKVRRFYQ